jgi:lipoprotein-releasing system permease protein
LKISDIYDAPAIAAEAEKVFGPDLAATTWMEQNGQLLNALRMERAVTVVTIGLIQLVAALNILIALVMMVMERYRDIAVLMSMGARQAQIRSIFIFEGIVIGVTGTILGLIAGHTLSYLADRNRWITLDEQIYALAFVPFEARWMDSIWVAGIAILVSFLATIYPARSASRIAPVEVLRYE